MAQSASFIVLVAALLINTLSYCSAENVYCVTPNATSCSSCPSNSTHCATLSEYAQEAELYFTSNTTMLFLPGDHVLDRNITVVNITRLTMCGHGGSSSDNRATVVCNGSVGFSFTNMVDFNILSLAFTSYNRSWSYGSHPASNSALFLHSTKYAKLVNCSFHDNLGTALTVHNTNITLAENNEFVHNQCRCQSSGVIHELGCGITALYSTLTITGNSSFHDNSQTAFYPFNCGGAIWASASSLHFTGTNNFTANSAEYGGSVYVQTNTLLSLNGNNIFYHNSAYRGGAIYTEANAVLTFTGTNIFTGNSAQYGGAIYAQANTLLSFSGTNIFVHNSAYSGGGGGGGGAFYASGSAILTFSGNNNFSSSTGYNGGVIYISGKVVLTLNGINNFINNSAERSGGVIYAEGRSTTLGNAVVTFNGTNNFINNSANKGGAIYTSRNVLLGFKDTSNFTHNSADYGGAIFTWSNALLTFNGTNNFFDNSAKIRHGGAILTLHSVFTFSGSNNFTGNSAHGNGGAIFAVRKVLLSFFDTSSFCSNSAMQGGAIFANLNSTVTFNGNISFTNNGQNTRDSCGGAMYLGISSTFSIMPHTTVCWENNHANLGGAIYVMNANPLIYCTKISSYIPKQECFFQLPRQNIHVKFVFKNNSANAAGNMLYGGAVDHCKLNGLNFSNSGEVFDLLAKHESDNGISSDPFYVCLCENDHLNCNKSNKTILMYPGETVQVSMVSTGQRNGKVPAQVRSHIEKGRLLSTQYVQQTMCKQQVRPLVWSLQQYRV